MTAGAASETAFELRFAGPAADVAAARARFANGVRGGAGGGEDGAIERWRRAVDEHIAYDGVGGAEQIARVEYDRWSTARRVDGSLIDAAFDFGRAAGSERPGAPFAELRFRLVEGAPEPLLAEARGVIDKSAGRLRPLLESRRAADIGAPPDYAKKKRPKLDLAVSAADVLAAGLEESARGVAALAGPLADWREAEGARAMRVALRRLRAYERAFRKGTRSNSLRELAARAKAYGLLLGEARDWEIFLGQSLPIVEARGYEPAGATRLRAIAEARRAAAWDVAGRAVAGPDFAHFVLDIVEAARLRPWRAAARPRLQRPAVEFAGPALDRRLAAAQTVAQTLDPRTPETLHALRIEIKKLRYTAQVFREFFPRAPRKQYLAPLAALQDRLGALNDAATAQLLACRAVEDVVAALDAGGETTAAAANRACGFICGFRRAEADIVAGEAAPAWAAIEAMTPYWRAPVGDAADAPPLALAAPPVQ